MTAQIVCLEHGKPVELRKAICHVGGGYCGSPGFTVAKLDRDQAMALLLVASGLALLGAQA